MSYTGRPRVYEETFTAVGGETLITLPSSEDYLAGELRVYLEGQHLTLTEDFSYVGASPYTQILLVAALEAGEKLVFRKF